jgi:hypothetical protein
VATAQPVGASLTPPAGPAQLPAALTSLNNAFRAAYSAAKTRALASSGPTLIASGDNLSLLLPHNRLEANVGARIYDSVKTIAHIPLSIYVTLTSGGKSPLPRGRGSAIC